MPSYLADESGSFIVTEFGARIIVAFDAPTNVEYVVEEPSSRWRVRTACSRWEIVEPEEPHALQGFAGVSSGGLVELVVESPSNRWRVSEAESRWVVEESDE